MSAHKLRSPESARGAQIRNPQLLGALSPAKEQLLSACTRGRNIRFFRLIVDELGYVRASKAGAEQLFDVIATAYERYSLVVTTNVAFENWTEVLDSERLTGAALNRSTHRCHILETKGQVLPAAGCEAPPAAIGLTCVP